MGGDAGVGDAFALVEFVREGVGGREGGGCEGEDCVGVGEAGGEGAGDGDVAGGEGDGGVCGLEFLGAAGGRVAGYSTDGVHLGEFWIVDDVVDDGASLVAGGAEDDQDVSHDRDRGSVAR